MSHATDARKVFKKFSPDSKGFTHPLDGKSVADWVAEARKGWPKVPAAPKDPAEAARKIAAKYGDEVDLGA